MPKQKQKSVRATPLPLEIFAHQREFAVALRELMVADHIPEEDVPWVAVLIKAATEAEAALLYVKSLVVREAVHEVLTHLPPSLTLSPEERERLTTSVDGTLDEFPDADWPELLWRFVLDAIRPHTRGRKPKWSGPDGFFLVMDAETLLQSTGLKWRKKGLREAIEMLRRSQPKLYGKHSEETLRQAYYRALPLYPSACAGPLAIADLLLNHFDVFFEKRLSRDVGKRDRGYPKRRAAEAIWRSERAKLKQLSANHAVMWEGHCSSASIASVGASLSPGAIRSGKSAE